MKRFVFKLCKTTALTFSALAIGVQLLPVTVFADDTEPKFRLEEIIVTARKRSELLTDVPGTVVAFTEGDIKRANIQRAEDFINLTPGVMMISGAVEVGDTQVNIRGISGVRDGTGSFAYIIDGILYPNPWGFNREYANLQQIEILKGPQGALYGRNAAAGAIIVTTKKPGEEVEGSVKLKAGQDNSRFVAVSLSGPIVEGKLAGRLSADYSETDGFYKNSFTGKDDTVGFYEAYNVDGRLIWTPSDDLEIDARLHYSDVYAASILANALPSFLDINDHKYIFETNVDPKNGQELLEFSVKLDYDMGWAGLTAWVLHTDMDQYFIADGTSGGFQIYYDDPACIASAAAVFESGYQIVPPFYIGATLDFPTSFLSPYTPTTCDGYQYQERDQIDTSLEIRLTSAGEGPLRWMAGFYYLDEERKVGVGQYYDDGTGNYIKSMFNELADSVTYDRYDTEAWAVFGSVDYDITPDIELSFALRYDSEDRDATSLVPPEARSRFVEIDGASTTFNGGYPLNAALVNFDADGNAISFKTSLPSRSESFEQAQPKVSVRWTVNDELSVYASYGVGFKSGGFNPIGGLEIIESYFNEVIASELSFGNEFEKEVNAAFELGFKARLFDDRLSLDGAVFHTQIDDMQFFEFLVGRFGLLRVVSTIDEAKIKGFELASKFQATENFSVYAGLSLVDGEIEKNVNRPLTKGNELPNTPEHTINVGGTLIVPVATGVDVVARVDYSIVGSTWFHTLQEGDVIPTSFGFSTDLALAERDKYDLLNVSLGLEGESWSVRFIGKNILDEDYSTEVITAPEFGGSFILPGARRALALELQYNF